MTFFRVKISAMMDCSISTWARSLSASPFSMESPSHSRRRRYEPNFSLWRASISRSRLRTATFCSMRVHDPLPLSYPAMFTPDAGVAFSSRPLRVEISSHASRRSPSIFFTSASGAGSFDRFPSRSRRFMKE